MICQDCGMPVGETEYHPYGACLMFRGCGDAIIVSANLDAVRANGAQWEHEALQPEMQQLRESLRVIREHYGEESIDSLLHQRASSEAAVRTV